MENNNVNENKSNEVVKEFAKSNEKLLGDMKNVIISVSVGAVGYFLIELGKGLVSAVTTNGIKVPELPTK